MGLAASELSLDSCPYRAYPSYVVVSSPEIQASLHFILRSSSPSSRRNLNFGNTCREHPSVSHIVPRPKSAHWNTSSYEYCRIRETGNEERSFRKTAGSQAILEHLRLELGQAHLTCFVARIQENRGNVAVRREPQTRCV